MSCDRIVALLTEQPRTVRDLAAHTGSHPAVIRSELARLVFERREVTCGRDDRFRAGDPAGLLMVST